MDDMLKVSPSRRYVISCHSSEQGAYVGYYFKWFKLPAKVSEIPKHAIEYAVCHEIVNGKNNVGAAIWYFLNVLDSHAYAGDCYTWEDYHNLKKAKDTWSGKYRRCPVIIFRKQWIDENKIWGIDVHFKGEHNRKYPHIIISNPWFYIKVGIDLVNLPW